MTDPEQIPLSDSVASRCKHGNMETLGRDLPLELGSGRSCTRKDGRTEQCHPVLPTGDRESAGPEWGGDGRSADADAD